MAQPPIEAVPPPPQPTELLGLLVGQYDVNFRFALRMGDLALAHSYRRERAWIAYAWAKIETGADNDWPPEHVPGKSPGVAACEALLRQGIPR